jgi:hypothetical protein
MVAGALSTPAAADTTTTSTASRTATSTSATAARSGSGNSAGATAAAHRAQPPVTGGGGVGATAPAPKPAPKQHSGRIRSATVSDSGHVYPGDSRHLGDRVLRQGMSGHDVRVLQDFLTRAGFATGVDGQFGPGTRRNVVAFQRARGLKPSGVVTWSVAEALRSAVAATADSTPRQSYPDPVGHAAIVNGRAVAPSDAPPAIKAVIAAANKIAFKPYIYGGGHGSWNDSGYDCSGSVSYALHGGHLLSQPEDSGSLESYGRSGPGRWITIWANGGHVYMYVAGLRFDTSAQSETGGSRWIRQRRSNDGFVERHPTGY